jgi:hypothetical protein
MHGLARGATPPGSKYKSTWNIINLNFSQCLWMMTTKILADSLFDSQWVFPHELNLARSCQLCAGVQTDRVAEIHQGTSDSTMWVWWTVPLTHNQETSGETRPIHPNRCWVFWWNFSGVRESSQVKFQQSRYHSLQTLGGAKVMVSSPQSQRWSELEGILESA